MSSGASDTSLSARSVSLKSDKDALRSTTQPRVVCGCVPVERDTGRVLVISSRKHAGRWVLPKGGWEESDASLEEAALREAHEEAGVRGAVQSFLLTVDDHRPIKTLKATDSFIPRARYHFYEVAVSALDDEWDEKDERTREWVSFPDALERVGWRAEQKAALDVCSLNHAASPASQTTTTAAAATATLLEQEQSQSRPHQELPAAS